MSTDYEPGTVAMVRFDGEEVRAMRTGLKSNPGWEISRPNGQAWVADKNTTEGLTVVRPLVVLDVKHENGWSHAIHALRMQTSSAVLWDLADQIEAQTVPPKPAEPTGLGAVVEDANGQRWVRCENADLVPHWYGRSKMRRYSDLDVVRVLSEGAPA